MKKEKNETSKQNEKSLSPHTPPPSPGEELTPMMCLMADIAALEKKARAGLSAVPELVTALVVELVAALADRREALASFAVKTLAACVPRAALPPRFPAGGLAASGEGQPGEAALPAWLTDNPFHQDSFALARLCADMLPRLEQEHQLLFLQRAALLAGLRGELAQELERRDVAMAAAFQGICADLSAAQYPRQISFSPTMSCPLHCAYCIAGMAGMAEKGQAPEAEAGEAGEEEVLRLFAWMERYQVARLGLTGGEPTIYSRFAWLLALARERGIALYLASNGLMPPASLAALQKYPPLCLTLHLTPEVLAAPELRKRFLENAQKLRQAGVNAILRCNFSEPGEEIAPYLAIAQQCDLKELRFAIPMPNLGRANRHVALPQLAAFAPLVQRLADGAARLGLRLALSKPYPLCLLPEAVVKDLLAGGSLSCLCPNYQVQFSNNLVVYPNLAFSPCLGLNSRSARPMTDFSGPEDAAQLFAPEITRRMRSPLLPACSLCPLGLDGRCVGACLSYRPDVSVLS